MIAGDLLDLSTQTSVVTLSGYVGKPESARKGQACQFFFVNGRYFRSAYLAKAVLKAYEGMIPEGTIPSYFISLEVPPYSIDVNVSPTKTEIKFEEDSIIFQTLAAAVRGVLGQQSFSDTLDFEGSKATQIPISSRPFMKLGFDELIALIQEGTSFAPYNTKVTFDQNGKLIELLYSYSPWN